MRLRLHRFVFIFPVILFAAIGVLVYQNNQKLIKMTIPPDKIQKITVSTGQVYAVPILWDLHFPFTVRYDRFVHVHKFLNSRVSMFENVQNLAVGLPANDYRYQRRLNSITLKNDEKADGAVYFVTKDKTDPRTNGRLYSITGRPVFPLWLALLLVFIALAAALGSFISFLCWRANRLGTYKV